MCNRYAQTKDRLKLQTEFAGIVVAEVLKRYNIAPTQTAPVALVQDGTLGFQDLRWGFDGHAGPVMNARSETAHEKRLFRNAWSNGHCLVPADGFYDWRTMPDGKQPYHFMLPGRDLFWFAGMFDGDRFVILTGPPSGFIATMHDRMPLLLKPDAAEGWLTKSWTPDELRANCQPGEVLTHYPVTREMSRASHITPDCIEPIEIAQQELF